MGFHTLNKDKYILKCTGSPYQRGLQQGEAYQKQIALTLNAFFQSDSFQLFKPQWLPLEMGVKWAALKNRYTHASGLKKYAPDMMAFLEGLAEGAQRPLAQVLFLASAENLLPATSYKIGGGTTLALPPEFSGTGDPLIIKNIDNPFYLRYANIIRKTQPDQGLASIEVTTAPFAGCFAGLNEAGVAIVSNYAHHQDKTPFWFPISYRIQEALQNCKTAEEVIHFFKTKKQSGGALLSVLDSAGKLFTLEISPHRFEYKAIENNFSIQTNHYQNILMNASDISINAQYPEKKGLTELAGKRIKESSEQRFDRLFDLCGTKIQFHETDLKNYFRDHSANEFSNDNTLCRHGELYETSASVLIKPLQREIQVALGSPCEAEYKTYQLI